MYDGGEHTPKLLPCSHTVCLQCLDRIVATFARDTGQFRCPICRELITIPRGGVSALPPSFLVNQLLDLMARQRREVIPKCSTHQTQVRRFFAKGGSLASSFLCTYVRPSVYPSFSRDHWGRTLRAVRCTFCAIRGMASLNRLGSQIIVLLLSQI